MSKIVFAEEAHSWDEALPIGSGILGGMVFGGTDREHIQLNEDSLWSGGPMERTNPQAASHLDEIRDLLMSGHPGKAEALASQTMFATYPHMRHYMTAGDLWIDFDDPAGRKVLRPIGHGTGLSFVGYEHGAVTGYHRTLDLDQAIGKITYTRDGVLHEHEFLASAPCQALVYHVSASEPIGFAVSLTRKDGRPGCSCSFCDGVRTVGDDTCLMYGHEGGEDGIGWAVASKVLVSGGGTVRTCGSGITVSGTTEATVLVTARTTYRSKDPQGWCEETLSRAASKGFEAIRAESIQDYTNLFDRCRLELPREQDLEDIPTTERLAHLREDGDVRHVDLGLVNTYFDYARYLLISSSREGSLPSNLQGVWNPEMAPMWGSRYTININTEMNYWLAEPTGLGELQKPLFGLMGRMRPRGERVAREMYGARGWVCHHNTDLWGDCAPQDTNLAASIWPMGAAWLCLNVAQHWRYTRDEAFLRREYPLVREAALFFVDYLVKDGDGHWLTGPSASPENCYASENGVSNLCMAPALDCEILRELFEAFLEMHDALGASEDQELASEVTERLAGLPPLRVGSHGQVMEWLHDYDEPEPGHRHISQLFALYPASQIRPDRTPELMEAARTTLDRRLSNGGGHTGWSKAWIVLLWCRLGEGELAWQNLRELLARCTLPNLLDNHPPFQIDGNFGGAMGVLEMLVRDYGDEAWLLPALPREMPEGRLGWVRLACGAELSISWAAGRLTQVRLRGLREGTTRLVLPGGVVREASFMRGEEVGVAL